MTSRTTQRRIGDVLTYLVFALALVFFGGPLLWVLSLSIRTPQEVYITSLQLIPETPTLENYTEVRPGRMSGRVTLKNAPKRVQPSTIAASSRAGGMPSKKPFSIQVASGTRMAM